jgi:hypothetical protein
MYVKETTLRENYEAAYELWWKAKTDLRKNTESKLLLKHKMDVLRNKKFQTLKLTG